MVGYPEVGQFQIGLTGNTNWITYENIGHWRPNPMIFVPTPTQGLLWRPTLLNNRIYPVCKRP